MPVRKEPPSDPTPTASEPSPTMKKRDTVRAKQPIRPDMPVRREPVDDSASTQSAPDTATQKKERPRPRRVIRPDVPVRSEPGDEETDIESLVVTDGEREYRTMYPLKYTHSPTPLTQLPPVLPLAILPSAPSANVRIPRNLSFLTRTWMLSSPPSPTAHSIPRANPLSPRGPNPNGTRVSVSIRVYYYIAPCAAKLTISLGAYASVIRHSGHQFGGS
jgi:hypothetical protein